MKFFIVSLLLCFNYNIASANQALGTVECLKRSCKYVLQGGIPAEQLLSQLDGVLRQQTEISESVYIDIMNSVSISGKFEITYYHPDANVRAVVNELFRELDQPYLVNNRKKIDIQFEIYVYSLVQAREMGFSANFGLDSLLNQSPARSSLNNGIFTMNFGNLTNHILSLSASLAKNAGLEIWYNKVELTDLYNGEDLSGIGRRSKDLYFTGNSVSVDTETSTQEYNGSVLIDEVNPEIIHLRDFYGNIPRENINDFSLLENLAIGNYNHKELVHEKPEVIFSSEVSYRLDTKDSAILSSSSSQYVETLKVVVVATAKNKSILDKTSDTYLDPQTNLYSFNENYLNTLKKTTRNFENEVETILNSVKGFLMPSPFSTYTQSPGIQIELKNKLSQQVLDTPLTISIKGKDGLKGLKNQKHIRIENLVAGPIFFFDMQSPFNLGRLAKEGEATIEVSIKSKPLYGYRKIDFSADYEFYYAPTSKMFHLTKKPKIRLR